MAKASAPHRAEMFPAPVISSTTAYNRIVGYGRLQASKGRQHPGDVNDLTEMDRTDAALIIEAQFYLTTGAIKAAWYKGAREWQQEQTTLPGIG